MNATKLRRKPAPAPAGLRDVTAEALLRGATITLRFSAAGARVTVYDESGQGPVSATTVLGTADVMPDSPAPGFAEDCCRVVALDAANLLRRMAALPQAVLRAG